MAAGIMEKYMPETGGRWDIAPLPHWQALYLLTMDARAYEVTLATADLGASFASHYRNPKSRQPVTLDAYPKFSTHSNLVGKGPDQLPLPDTGGYSDPLAPDAAHEPALDFLPYLITGDRFYLEELQFWAEWEFVRHRSSIAISRRSRQIRSGPRASLVLKNAGAGGLHHARQQSVEEDFSEAVESERHLVRETPT